MPAAYTDLPAGARVVDPAEYGGPIDVRRFTDVPDGARVVDPAEWGGQALIQPGETHEARPTPEYGVPVEGFFKDFLPSLGTGIAQGAYELATLPVTAFKLGSDAANAAARGIGIPQPIPDDYGFMGPVVGLQQQGREGLASVLHEPQTTGGEFARTIGEFAPGAVALGPARPLPNLIRYGVLPGLASEGAGQLFEGTSFEPWARAAAAIVGAGGMAALSNAGAGAGLPGNLGASAAIVSRSLRGSNLTDAELTAAGNLINQGRQQGITLTWPEALHAATNGRVDATALQRVIEQSRGGQPIMAPVMAERPVAASQAMARTAAATGPTSSPAQLGQLTQELADDAIRYVREQINAATRPLYTAAGPTTVDPVAFGRLYNDPLVQAAIRDIRNSPVYSRTVSGMSDDSVAMMDALKKYFDDLGGKAAGERTQFAASVYGSQSAAARDAATAASPEYAQALQEQSILRRDYLAPMEGGPLGAMAGTADLGTQLGALFPKNPFSGSAAEVRQTIGTIAGQNPDAAAALVRQHVEQVFNQATRNLTRGQNQFGPARFVAEIKGNPQQAANLEAAVRALPNGDARWEGLSSLMRVLEATGARQPAGSGTTFNSAMYAEMSRGTPIPTLIANITSPTQAAGAVGRWYADFRLGRNSASLARIITDPASGPLLQRLAMGGSLKDMQAVAAALLSQTAPVVGEAIGQQNFGGGRSLPALVPQQ